MSLENESKRKSLYLDILSLHKSKLSEESHFDNYSFDNENYNYYNNIKTLLENSDSYEFNIILIETDNYDIHKIINKTYYFSPIIASFKLLSEVYIDIYANRNFGKILILTC